MIDGDVVLQVVNKKLKSDDGADTPHEVASIFEHVLLIVGAKKIKQIFYTNNKI